MVDSKEGHKSESDDITAAIALSFVPILSLFTSYQGHMWVCVHIMHTKVLRSVGLYT